MGTIRVSGKGGSYCFAILAAWREDFVRANY